MQHGINGPRDGPSCLKGQLIEIQMFAFLDEPWLFYPVSVIAKGNLRIKYDIKNKSDILVNSGLNLKSMYGQNFSHTNK